MLYPVPYEGAGENARRISSGQITTFYIMMNAKQRQIIHEAPPIVLIMPERSTYYLAASPVKSFYNAIAPTRTLEA